MKENAPPNQREISLVFGKTGMGKSNWLKVYLQSLRRVIILDPLDEYPAQEFTDAEEMLEHVASKKEFKVKSCNILDLEVLGEIVDSLNDVTFLIEEAQRCLPASGQGLPDSIQRIIFLGRHFGRSLLIAAQRPSIVNIAARSQWTRIVTFNVTETTDVKWLKDQSGYPLDVEPDIRKLPVGEYFEITPGNLEVKNAPLYIPRRKEEKESELSKLLSVFSPSTF
jgi:DNA helicase HerA-like ATPase